MSISNTVLEIINNLLKKEGLDMISKLDPALSLTDDLGLDSLALAELTVVIEDCYGVDIYEGDIIYTIGEILERLPL
jgi:acyl carrier protein